MGRSTFFVISLYYSALAFTYAATLPDGTIIEIETIEPKKPNQFNINKNLNTFTGGTVQNGRTQYQTVVNGKPVTIEIIREDQLNRYGQMQPNRNYWQQMQNQNYWQQMQNQNYWQKNQNRYPIKPNQGNVFITKENSPYPNIEVYDVITTGDNSNSRYPVNPNQNTNKYPNILPYPNPNINNNRNPNINNNGYPNINNNGYPNINNNRNPSININRYPTIQPEDGFHYFNNNRYPNENLFPYPNQNNQNSNSNNKQNQQDDNLSSVNNKTENTKQSNGDIKDEEKNNVAGYIDKFPVILLNENEIRR